MTMTIDEFDKTAIRGADTNRETIDLHPFRDRQAEAAHFCLNEMRRSINEGTFTTNGKPIFILNGRGTHLSAATLECLKELRKVGIPINLPEAGL